MFDLFNMKSGIYQIINKITGHSYIGSSKNLKRRHNQHLRLLKSNKNHSIHLQRAWNKYGADSFEFKILSYCTEDLLFKLEQWFVDNLHPEYNICIQDVSVPIGLNHQQNFDKEKYSIIAKERLKTNENFGWKSQIIEKLDDAGNVIETYSSLKEFAIIHSCSIGNVGKALKRGNNCKGFKIRYKNKP